jgi:hypothetical protein
LSPLRALDESQEGLIGSRLFGLLGVQVLLQHDAELLAQGLELVQVLLVLAVVLDLGLNALEDADGGGKVVHSAGSLEGGSDDRGGGDEIVGKGVVQVALKFRQSLVGLAIKTIGGPRRQLQRRSCCCDGGSNQVLLLFFFLPGSVLRHIDYRVSMVVD